MHGQFKKIITVLPILLYLLGLSPHIVRGSGDHPWGLSGRVESGLVVLYTFEEGDGKTVHDVSGVGAPLDLWIEDPGTTRWIEGGGLSIDAETLVSSAEPATSLVDACRGSDEITTDAETVTIEPEIGDVNPRGFQCVSPPETTEYTLTAVGPGGETTGSATVEVMPPMDVTVNFRSIGINDSILYETGTVSVAAGSTTAVFGDAILPENIGQGDRLTLGPGGADEEVLYVLSRDSDIQVTLQTSSE